MLPSLGDYMQTFQNPRYFLSDPELAKCTCPKDQQGQPKVQSGGFALTFRLEGANKKWAVRCFHREAKDRDRRYTAISAKLNQPAIRESGYFVDFEYQPRGVTVKGQWFPVVKMAWARGETLGTFLESNYKNRQKLKNLQTSLRQLYHFLSSNHIAHGDIQPGNLMVSDDGQKVQLIDYDGMFVPGMESLNAIETGVPNFQHKERRDLNPSPWNERLDRFPFIMFDIAISILQVVPDYWTKTGSSDEKVLFDVVDYSAPYGSKTFSELKADVRFAQQISILQKICSSPFDQIPDAENYLSFSQVSVQNQAKQAQPVSISFQGAYKVLDARDVSEIAKHVGDVVEIVGRVINIKSGITGSNGKTGQHNNLPYRFINFRYWIRNVDNFYLVLWNDGLNEFRKRGCPFNEKKFDNKFVSAIGMITKYNGKYGTAYQLVLETPTKIKIITEDDANFRLGKTKKKVGQNFGVISESVNAQLVGGSNAERLRTLVGSGQLPNSQRQKPQPSQGASPKSSTSSGSNAARLQKLLEQNGGVPPSTKKSSAPVSKSTSRQSSNSGPAMASSTKATSDGCGCACWCIVGVVILIIVLVNCFGS